MSSRSLLSHAGWFAALLAAVASCQPKRLEISGTVEARRVDVAAEIAARIVKLHAREGERVTAGQSIVQLDCALPEADLAGAVARVKEAEAQLALLRAGARPEEIAAAAAALATAQANLELARQGARPERIAQYEAALADLDAQIELARLSQQRATELVRDRATSQAVVDETNAQLASVRAQRERTVAELAEARLPARDEELRSLEGRVAAARAQLDLLKAGARAEDIVAAEARLELARATVRAAEERQSRCQLVAPVAGLLEIVDYEEGELAPQGALVFAIAKDGPLRVRTFAPQRTLGDLQVGDRVNVTVDGFPARPLAARVERIDDQAEFTGGNVQTSDDRMLLVFRVDLELDPTDDPPVRPGTSVIVDFEHRTR